MTQESDILAESTLLMTDEDIDTYVAEVLAALRCSCFYSMNTDELDVVMKEMFIAFYGNAYEFYNAYRSTGKPITTYSLGIDQADRCFPTFDPVRI